MKHLGICIASGVLYYGFVADPPGGGPALPTHGAAERLMQQSGHSAADAARILDTHSRIKQDLREFCPGSVVLVATRQHAAWTYRKAFERASLTALTMLSCAELSVPCEEWKTERIGKLVGLEPQALAQFDHRVLGFETRPKYWTAGRAVAFAAARASSLESGA